MDKMIESAFVDNTPLSNNYSRRLLHVRNGKGSYLWDTSGNRYLDFGAGIAVNALGYGRRDLARCAWRQMRRLTHVSNLYTTEQTIAMGERIIGYRNKIGKEYTAVFFGNSGAEANETALKYARLYSYANKGPGHHALVGFEHGFHGRTMGALSMSSSQAYRKKFEPLIPDTITIPYNDIETLQRTLNRTVAGVIVEVIQGEGGLGVMSEDFALVLNRLCAEYDIILIADEVQTGLGRTGTVYASEWIGLAPDILTLAKPLAGGLPLSATVMVARVNNSLNVGDHGSTFGGGPAVAAVASRVWDLITNSRFLERVRWKRTILREGLDRLAMNHRSITDIVGEGLLQGIAIGNPDDDGRAWRQRIIARAREQGLLVLRSGINVVRIAPPLIITSRHIERGLRILDTILYEIDADVL